MPKCSPRSFTTAAYQYILQDPSQILTAYGVTITVTLIGTCVGVLIMALLAYSLSRKDFLGEVRYVAPTLTEHFSVLDEDLPGALRAGFAKHPWVEKVDEVHTGLRPSWP